MHWTPACWAFWIKLLKQIYIHNKARQSNSCTAVFLKEDWSILGISKFIPIPFLEVLHINENKWNICDHWILPINLDVMFSRICYNGGLPDCFEDTETPYVEGFCSVLCSVLYLGYFYDRLLSLKMTPLSKMTRLYQYIYYLFIFIALVTVAVCECPT